MTWSKYLVNKVEMYYFASIKWYPFAMSFALACKDGGTNNRLNEVKELVSTAKRYEQSATEG